MREAFDPHSNDNALFVTSRCNNRCLMCCQPPQADPDAEHLFAHNVRLLQSAPPDLPVLGITGGEPTLLGERLVALLEEAHRRLPHTAFHLLSNGRAFSDAAFVRRVCRAAGDNLFVGIPLHSDYAGDHDLIAGCRGAYEETLTGLYNLADAGVEIELRVVVNRLNYARLPRMADFIFKYLPFVGWTALMAMERTGLSVPNEAQVWAEPRQYAPQLRQAVLSLAGWGMGVAVYNVPLCLLPRDCWPYAKQSISDWKTAFAPRCEACRTQAQCCGLFSTSIRPFEGITPILEP
ncbi:MAG: His-Xaa-Ser system radical SAM maturase HxsC [Bacteroidales bacterium]|nr:His-Xaa-Ser system radical SAM maturase HxsC [Bacteroidales bacterium]MBQ9639893.1 His-Xaa-Ser system radical SAM maturase HxsC [Bacteroidales bacterium]